MEQQKKEPIKVKPVNLNVKKDKSNIKKKYNNKSIWGIKLPESSFVFDKKKYIMLITGIFILALGYILMIGGGSDDPDVFSYELFDFRRLTLSPIILFAGFIVIGVAIMIKPEGDSKDE